MNIKINIKNNIIQSMIGMASRWKNLTHLENLEIWSIYMIFQKL